MREVQQITNFPSFIWITQEIRLGTKKTEHKTITREGMWDRLCLRTETKGQYNLLFVTRRNNLCKCFFILYSIMQSSLESNKTRKHIYFLNKLGTFSSFRATMAAQGPGNGRKMIFHDCSLNVSSITSPETPNDWPQRALPADFSLNPLNQQRALQICMKELIICSVLYSKLNTVSNIP